MKSSLAVLSIALLAVLPVFAQEQGADATKRPASKAHVLTRTEFDALVAQPEKLVIIDVRRPDEVTSNGGFPVYLSIQLADLEKSVAWIPKERTVITVSNHAARGGRAADLLASKGFRVAGTIGAQNYEEAGGKLTKLAAPPKQADAAK
jgi:rhodanese-related sulfurtransferase